MRATPKLRVAAVSVAVLLLGCGDDDRCVEGASRCAGANVWDAEVCSGGEWVPDDAATCEAGVCRCVQIDTEPGSTTGCLCNPGG